MLMNEQGYEEAYSRDNLWGKLTSLPSTAGCALIKQVLVLYYLLESSELSPLQKGMIIGALGYFISPIDAIPDVIPLIGYSDDAAIIATVVMRMEHYITPTIKRKAASKLPQFCQ
jgi:uncharacterized membrane protein YkvA (DUF1232 family)